MEELSDTTVLVTQEPQVGKAVRKPRLITRKSTAKFVKLKKGVDRCEGTVVPAWLISTRKAFSSTACGQSSHGTGVFSTPPPTAGLAFSIGMLKIQNVQTS
jgi:hypothetical protein